MNIENIKALAAQLQAIGIKNAAPALLRRICFQPERFVLEKRTTKGGDTVSIQCHIQIAGEGLDYLLMFYDVTLLGETTLPDEEINGVSVQMLDKQMVGIDWKTAYDFTDEKAIVIEDRATWEEEARIAEVVASLARLQTTEEGRQLATLLKGKHWWGITLLTPPGTGMQAKGKADLSQRFYAQNNDNLISVDDACRFLQNKQVEKRLQMNKKPKAPTLTDKEDANTVRDGRTSNGRGKTDQRKSGRRTNSFKKN